MEFLQLVCLIAIVAILWKGFKETIETIEDKLKKHSYEVRPHMAIINALHSIPDAFEMKM